MKKQPIVRMVGIDKTFNVGTVNEMLLFRNFNLDVTAGEFVSVVGSNGSGKTTMLNILCGSVKPDAGDIYVKEKNITDLTEHQHSKFIGRVYQNPAMGTCPSMTILENMSLADNKGKVFALTPGVNKKRMDFYKSQLELLKMGLENQMDTPVKNLSGGQRQALSLLIATMTEIDLLILDEHTAALDPKSADNVMELTHRFVREKKLTTLMVTHNLRFAVNYGDRLMMMHRGQIVMDLNEKDKQKIQIRDLTGKFNEISIEDGC